MTLISVSAFARCRNLRKIIIPNSVIQIDDFAFSECNSLTSITLPSSLNRIRGAAFRGCNSLSEINIPASLKKVRFDVTYFTYIGAFEGCSSLPLATKSKLRELGYSGEF